MGNTAIGIIATRGRYLGRAPRCSYAPASVSLPPLRRVTRRRAAGAGRHGSDSRFCRAKLAGNAVHATSVHACGSARLSHQCHALGSRSSSPPSLSHTLFSLFLFSFSFFLSFSLSHSLTWMNLPSGRYHCLMLSGEAEANVFSFGCAQSARMLFLWLVSVQMLRPAARSQSRTVLSCDPEMT